MNKAQQNNSRNKNKETQIRNALKNKDAADNGSIHQSEGTPGAEYAEDFDITNIIMG